MRFAAVTLALAALVAAAPAAEELSGASARAPTESGSWCNQPKGEAFWGQATSDCCGSVGGGMGSDRRCRGLNTNGNTCHQFYQCCRYKYRSNNRENDKCY
ncbi:hypothetical protein C2857_000677 [Epichloe festucae Fl1]|uniref:Uncharacterized protein n=1 Tax=Epichloe festucae (strain Fl1) TaxID=877507 RepID=A0A7S9KVB0_EPIFF|nr:hypothetical protein C2857_000677 [Epichloe festucae Fl1]